MAGELDFREEAKALCHHVAELDGLLPDSSDLKLFDRALREAAAKRIAWALKELADQPEGAADRIHATLTELRRP